MDSLTAQKILRRDGWCPVHLVRMELDKRPRNPAANVYGVEQLYCPKCREEESEKRHAEFSEALAYLRRTVNADGGQGPNSSSESDTKELRPKRGLPGKGE